MSQLYQVHDAKNLPDGFTLRHNLMSTHPITYELFRGDVIVATIREASGRDPELIHSFSPDHFDVIAEIWKAKKVGDDRDRRIMATRFLAECDAEREVAARAAADALQSIDHTKEGSDG